MKEKEEEDQLYDSIDTLLEKGAKEIQELQEAEVESREDKEETEMAN